MDLAKKISICHRCKHKEATDQWSYVCLGDDRREDFVAKCERGECPLGNFPNLTPDTPVATIRRLISRPDLPHVEQWHEWANVQQAYREEMSDAIKAIPAMPAWGGRGVVIVGGGKYFASTYVTLRILRHVGCTLPVEVWYLGERHEILPWQSDLLSEYGATCIDANQVAESAGGVRNLAGWELKPFAVLHSRFAELHYLDADSYPVQNPERLFDEPGYRATGALFTPDPWRLKLLPEIWRALGIPFRDERTFESGQFLIDKRRCWEPLWLTNWMNQHSDYYYRLGPKPPVTREGHVGQGVYGDKDTWHLAWRYLDRDYSIADKDYKWISPAMLQHAPDGTPFWVHRVRRKFTLDTSASDHFGTSPQEGPEYQPDLPLEDVAHGFLDELRGLVPSNTAARFGNIYQKNLWGGGSGHGSQETSTTPYRELLKILLATGKFRRVVDLGCGDWKFSRLVDWSGVDYLGIDCVQSVIDANQRKYGRAGIRFEFADLLTYDPPECDLLIVKDVIQHWPASDILTWLERMNGRPLLITNTVWMAGEHEADIPMGGFRPLDVRLAPFNVTGQSLLEWDAIAGDRKAVLWTGEPLSLDIEQRKIPLAGDLVAAVAKKFGADRAARAIARLVGKADCGCARRQQRINRLDARLRRAAKSILPG